MAKGREAPVGVSKVSVAPVTPVFWGMVGPSVSEGASISVPGVILMITRIITTAMYRVLSSSSQPPFEVGVYE